MLHVCYMSVTCVYFRQQYGTEDDDRILLQEKQGYYFTVPTAALCSGMCWGPGEVPGWVGGRGLLQQCMTFNLTMISLIIVFNLKFRPSKIVVGIVAKCNF